EHRQAPAVPGQRVMQAGRLTKRELAERRPATRHALVMMDDLLESLARNATAARDDLEKRTDLVWRRRPPERDQQHRIDGAHRRALSSCTLSTSACTCSTGVDRRIPWPRLNM